MSEFTMSGNDKICAFCKGYAEQKCSVCKIVYYCCREHQKSDWKTHSKNCGIVKLVDDSKFGRHYIATRDIEIDEIVLKENKPLLLSPNAGTESVCLNCYVSLTNDTANPCKNCGWPLCRDCKKHGPECQLTIKYRRSKIQINQFSVPNFTYDSVTIMRAIALKKKSPDDFKKLLNLEDHYTEVANNTYGGICPIGTNERARSVRTSMKIDSLNEAEIVRILGIVRINGYKILSPKKHQYIAVFDKVSYFAHDCRPNCMSSSYYDVKTEAKLVVKAVRTIPKGQPITVTYTNPLEGTEKRRKILALSKFFYCTCERCKDPTEFGTMFSAVKCFQENCTGYMLPPTFLAPSNERIPDWVCQKCDLTATSAAIDAIMADISSQLSRLDSKNLNEFKKFIVEQSKILHCNHFHILNAHIHVIYNEENQDHDSMSNELLKEKITLLKKLNGLLEIIAPCEYGIRGTIRYSEFEYTMTLCARESSRNRVKTLSLYENCKKLLNEAYRLLRNGRDENTTHRVEMIRLQLEDFNRWSDVFKITKPSS